MSAYLDATRILTRREYARILDALRNQRSVTKWLNLIIFRLSACCGLRVAEISALRMRDVHVGIERAFINVTSEGAKGGKPRRVPLWWDGGTLADVTAWMQWRRREHAAEDNDFVVCSLREPTWGEQLTRFSLRQHFKTLCGVLGRERARTVTIHHGRHSFISHALAGGRTLAEVQAAAGHASLSTTARYVHVAVDDDGAVGSIFSFQRAAGRRGDTQPPPGPFAGPPWRVFLPMPAGTVADAD